MDDASSNAYGSGKSTLINILSGIEYVLEKNKETNSSYLAVKSKHMKEVVKTGCGVEHITVYPQSVLVKDIAYCDTPSYGFKERSQENAVGNGVRLAYLCKSPE